MRNSIEPGACRMPPTGVAAVKATAIRPRSGYSKAPSSRSDGRTGNSLRSPPGRSSFAAITRTGAITYARRRPPPSTRPTPCSVSPSARACESCGVYYPDRIGRRPSRIASSVGTSADPRGASGPANASRWLASAAVPEVCSCSIHEDRAIRSGTTAGQSARVGFPYQRAFGRKHGKANL